MYKRTDRQTTHGGTTAILLETSSQTFPFPFTSTSSNLYCVTHACQACVTRHKNYPLSYLLTCALDYVPSVVRLTYISLIYHFVQPILYNGIAMKTEHTHNVFADHKRHSAVFTRHNEVLASWQLHHCRSVPCLTEQLRLVVLCKRLRSATFFFR